MSIRHICKRKKKVPCLLPFFLDMKISGEKTLLTLLVSSILIELLGIFIFTLVSDASKRFYVILPPPPPPTPYSGLGQQG